MKIHVKGSEEIWASKDGQKKIYLLDHDGEGDIYTYSDKIAGGGTFDVEVYPKESKKPGYPPQNFARQEKKDFGGGGGKWRPMTYDEAIELEQAKLPSMCMKWGNDAAICALQSGILDEKNFTKLAIKVAREYHVACVEMAQR